MKIVRPKALVFLGTISLLVLGCERDDEKVAKVAREAAERQARQNEQMAKLQEHVAKGTQQLVENATKSQNELTKLQRDLRDDQAKVSVQRDALEVERQQIATERWRDPIVAQTLLIAGGCIVALAPLLLAGYAFRVVETSRDDSLVASALIEDLASDAPRICVSPRLPQLPSREVRIDPEPTDPSGTPRR